MYAVKNGLTRIEVDLQFPNQVWGDWMSTKPDIFILFQFLEKKIVFLLSLVSNVIFNRFMQLYECTHFNAHIKEF